MRGAVLLFFESSKSVKFVIRCGLIFFELIKTVMVNSLAGHFFLKLQTSFFSSQPSPPHNSQRIDANTDATGKTTHTTTYYHILTQPNTTKPNTQFQHRYRPTSFQVARGLHRNTQKCFLHDANMSDRQGMGHGPCTLALRASQSCAYRESRLDE